jgi:hypothetical protein
MNKLIVFVTPRNLLKITIGVCLYFLIFSTIAMFFYPGGTVADSSERGYQFFGNFFSDLGRTIARNGEGNAVSFILFTSGLVFAGVGLVLFFIVFPRFFNASSLERVISLAGSVFGILAGLCFVGVAFTPANINGSMHTFFVMWAFRFFPLGILLYTITILFSRSYLHQNAIIFGIFSALLFGYLLLLTRGPDYRSSNGLIIQAAGQKIIVYASIVCILIQSYSASNLIERSN